MCSTKQHHVNISLSPPNHEHRHWDRERYNPVLFDLPAFVHHSNEAGHIYKEVASSIVPVPNESHWTKHVSCWAWGETLRGVGKSCNQWGMNDQMQQFHLPRVSMPVTQCDNWASPLTFQINRAGVGGNDFRALLLVCVCLFWTSIQIHSPYRRAPCWYCLHIPCGFSSANVFLLLSILLQQTESC